MLKGYMVRERLGTLDLNASSGSDFHACEQLLGVTNQHTNVAKGYYTATRFHV